LLYNFIECGVRLTDKLFSIYASGAGQPIVVEPRLGKLNCFLLELNAVVADPRLSIKEIANTLNRIRPDVIYGFPSILEELCALVTLKINPRIVFSHGGKLTERCRKIVESTFDAEVYDTYGSAEFWRLAFECDEHSGLHMITDCAVVECVRDGEVVAVGESGDVVVTGLSNYQMPLIRYELGDIAVLADESCACGRSWPLIRDIQGRTMDSFTLPSGRVLSVVNIFQWVYPEIKDYVYCFSQYQIVQESPKKIVLRIVKGKEYHDEIIDQITRRIKKDLEGENVMFSLDSVDEIPREKSGKRQQIVSYVNHTLPKS
jgi:phenylacetate-CoA ligase